MSSASATVSPTLLLALNSSGPVAALQGELELQVSARVEASRCGLFSFPCLSSCRSELGCVKGVSWWLFARLLVDLHHLLGSCCQLAHPLVKFQEAYHNLTRNLSSSINLLVSPCLLPKRSPAHSLHSPALLLARALFRACRVVDSHFLPSNMVFLYIERGTIFLKVFSEGDAPERPVEPRCFAVWVEVQGGTSSKLSPALLKAKPTPR